VGSGGIYRFQDREVNDHVFVILEYPQGRTVTFSSIESNDFDHITEVFMGTRGTLIIGYEGDVLLFGDKGDSIQVSETAAPTAAASARPTALEVSPKTGDAVLQASESRLADASGRATGAGARPVGGDTGQDRLLAYRLEIATFSAAIRAGTPLQCGVDMALKTTLACLAANEAMDKKVRVSVAV
jgi:predicted dehydrogenase